VKLVALAFVAFVLLPISPAAAESTTTTVASSANPSVFGQSVTFTATVVAPSSAIPTGTVTFTIDGSPQAPISLDGAGQATFTTSALALGSHPVNAQYTSNDANFDNSSGSLSQQVNAASTSTDLSASVNPSLVGQSVTFTATVTVPPPSSATPTGTVTFTIDGSPQAPISLNGAGVATFTTSALSLGSHTIDAQFTPNSSNVNGSSDSLTQGVFAVSTATTLGSSVNPSVLGQSVTFTATVSAVAPSSAVPTGSVTFTVDGGGAVVVGLNGSGQASFTTSTLSLGSHDIDGAYTPNSASFNASSDDLTQQVGAHATTTAVTSSENPSEVGASVTFTAEVDAPTSVTVPTGTVTFTIDGGSSLVVVLDGAGLASFTTSNLTDGSHAIAALYTPDSANFLSSEGNVDQQVETEPTTTTTTSTTVAPIAPTGATAAAAAVGARVTPTNAGGGGLPSTGSSTLGMGALALVLILAGLSLTWAARARLRHR
jgi:hypothetical protein